MLEQLLFGNAFIVKSPVLAKFEGKHRQSHWERHNPLADPLACSPRLDYSGPLMKTGAVV